MNKLIFIVLAFLLTIALHGQEISASKNSFLEQYSTYESTSQNSSYLSFFETHKIEMGLTDQDEFRLVSSEKGKSGYHHYKFDQYHQGIRVYGSTYLLHTKSGTVVSANGKYLPQVELSTQPGITKEQALESAISDMAAEQYSWELGTSSPRKNQLKPVPLLVIMDKDMPNFSGRYKLAYKIDLRSQVPFDGYTYFVDAHTSRVIKKVSLLKGYGVPGSGETKYYGVREFIVDSIGSTEYVLHDPTRGVDGITVYNNGQDVFTSTSSFFDLRNEEQDEVALDAHFSTAEMYDRLKNEFDWLGLDNKDGSMNVAIHANGGEDFVNAFWDGTYAWFGDGDCNNGPLTTLEVLAHEFMHGIIDYSSELIYSDESGAINESLADVMGHYMENEIDPANFSWSLGNSFALVEGLEPFRVMNDPAVVEDPEFYDGPFWEDGADVHTNSSIGNLIYVALSDGRAGENLQSEAFNVTGIGRAEAAKFLFYVNRNYLTASSNYHDYYEACMLASDEFFSGDVTMKENVRQAWTSVGIPVESATNDVLNISISSGGFRESCEWGGFGTMECTITNNGSLPYLGSSGGYVEVVANLEWNNYNERINLTEDIMPGEKQSFIIDSLIVLGDDFFFIDYDLILTEDNDGNDSSADYYFVREFKEGDISVNVIEGEKTCFQEDYELSFRLTNESCAIIEEGEQVKISLKDDNTGQLLWSEAVTIDRDISQGGSIFILREIDLGLTETTTFEVAIENDNDPNDENNVDFVSIRVLEPLAINYFNGFDVEDDLDAELFFETSSFGGNITQHSGSNQFFTTGFFDEADSPLCLDPERNWSEDRVSAFGNMSAKMNACLDLKGATTPVIHFEMTHYRNDFMSFVSEQSSSVRITTKQDGMESSQTIDAQKEGEKVEYNIPLPAGFKGSLEMKFITQTGAGSNSPEFLLYDIVFMDNFALLNTVANEELIESSNFQIYPNPVGDRLQVMSNTEIVSLSVTDINGRIVLMQKGLLGEQSLDVAILDAGYYVIELVDREGEKFLSKFIKI